ncbi:MAG: hypothetical protein R2795_15440 [Saprospiraceae bacterium]
MQKLIFLSIITLFLGACNSKPQGNIQLNNGKKWAVNDEMKPHIEMGNSILLSYLEQDGSDYKKLAADLKTQNDQLIKSCTMKGESHDELHKWLHPHITLVSDLAEAENATTAKSLVAQLEQSFKTYHNYFQ